MKPVCRVYLGKDLAEAFGNFHSDHATAHVISARFVGKTPIMWTGREGEIVEAWEFESWSIDDDDED